MTDAPPDRKPLRLFYAYAHKDGRLRDQLETTLVLLRRQGLIQEWHDRKISAGMEWEREIDKHLQAAHIILLLISRDFIASDYCFSIEMKQALTRHREGTARVIPIIVRTVEGWQRTELGELQALPEDGKAVDRWSLKAAAWANIERGIRRVIEEFQQCQAEVLPSDGPVSPRYALVLMDSSQEVRRFFLPFNKVVRIGRDEQADIRLDNDKKVSREHCTVCWSAEGFAVSDLSKNGTFVNEKKIDRTSRLYMRDSLRCGQTVFCLEDYNATESEDTDEPLE